MALNNPKPHHNVVGEFQVSGVPFVTSSAEAEVATTPIEMTFPYVSRWIMVENTHDAHALRFGFSANGVKAQETANYFVLSGGQKTDRMELKCTSVWFRQHGDEAVNYSLIAGLTNIGSGSYMTLTGSTHTLDGIG